MEIQKIVNLLNDSDNEYAKFATKKWYVIDKESTLFDYSDAYILVTGNITVTRTIAATAAAGDDSKRKKLLTAATQVVFKNCTSFKKFRTEINGTLVDKADFINISI